LRQAYRLKQLSSLPFQLGMAVHAAAAFAVRSARNSQIIPQFDDLRKGVVSDLNTAYSSSKNRSAWEARPNRVTMLREFYYEDKPSDQAIERVKKKIDPCVQNLLGAEAFTKQLQRLLWRSRMSKPL